MNDRLLPFEAIENFRDFGGYQGANGTVLRGRLFRAGQQSRATPADVDHMGRLDLGTIVDLRRSSERTEQPGRRPAGWSGQVIESDLGGSGEAPHIQFLKTQPLTKASANDFMSKLYRAMPFDPANVAISTAHFAALADSDQGVLVHCAAGKDRTGVLVALTQSVLGIDHDDIMADYLATNEAVRLDERAEAIGEKLSRMSGYHADREAVVAFLGVSADYLNQAWASIEQSHGTIERYLDQVLGVNADVAARIRSKLMP